MSKKARPGYLRQIVITITEGIGAAGQKVDEENRDISCLGTRFMRQRWPDSLTLHQLSSLLLPR